ncbi:histidine kinase [Mucilaginibacter sp. CAU 1740]|uniref:tetratricopeptide repeat-containing sensor histidine kinase n=1 Tax=Mucilaginibacter sp. CAU 1740 TaxID=3140365 RepID=UPI00325A624A
MVKKTVLVIYVIALMHIACLAQTTRLDSLKNKIGTMQTPQLKLQALFKFCDEWESMTPDTLSKFTKIADKIAIETKNNNARLQCDYYTVVCLFQKNKLDSASAAIDNVIRRLTASSPYDSRYPVYYGLRVNILMRGLHYDEVLKQNFRLIPIAEKYKDTVGLIRFNSGIGNAYARLKKLKDALKWHYTALKLMPTEKLKAKCSFVFTNLAIVYYHIATLNDTKANEDSIETYLQKSIYYARKNNNLTNLANGLTMYGQTLAEYGKMNPAKAALDEAVEVRKKIGDVHYLIADLTTLATFYKNNNNSAKAIELNQQALQLVNQNGGDILSKASVYDAMSEAFLAAHDYKRLSEVQSEKLKLRDSIYKENTAEAVVELQTKYDVQKNENTIIRQKYDLNRKQYLIYGITGLLVLLSALGVVILRQRKQKQKQKIKEILAENERELQQAISDAKEDERKRIIADLHDDVGGGLSTIRMVSDLIAEQNEQAEQLNQYAQKISGITKEVTQRMNVIVWALNAENDTLQSLIEYIRAYGFTFFENSPIKFNSNLPAEAVHVQLSGLQRKNVFLCVKEALNNIYKHSGAKNAWIEISMVDSTLTVTVKDDGGGLSKGNSFGNGLKNISKRMVEINGEATFENNEGTTVYLRVTITGNRTE